jgi:hypothetical protein
MSIIISRDRQQGGSKRVISGGYILLIEDVVYCAIEILTDVYLTGTALISHFLSTTH